VNLNRAWILRLAALTIVGMVIYMPTYVRMGNNVLIDFTYRFFWELGKTPDGWFTIEPAMGTLLGQVVVVVVIAGLLALAVTAPSKNEKPQIPKKLQGLFKEFQGSASRKEFFVVYLAVIATGVVIATLVTFVDMHEYVYLALMTVFAIVGNFFGIRAGVRRLHDLGRSGWWIILAIVPIVNIFLGLALLLIPGKTVQITT